VGLSDRTDYANHPRNNGEVVRGLRLLTSRTHQDFTLAIVLAAYFKSVGPDANDAEPAIRGEP
jgi:hypothetical protein